LAGLEQVFRLYMVDSDAESDWMNPANSDDPSKNIVGDNVSFDAIGSVGSLLEVLKDILDDMEETPYEDVFVTDYMSKWVTLEGDSIRIYDKEECIYAYNPATNTYEWMVDEDSRPTAEIPIEIQLVDPSEYPNGGAEVEGNSNGDIHKIIWKVKDGALLASDQYSMKYIVKVDTEEEGFQYDTEYVSNGTTTVHHKDNPEGDSIPVPTVEATKDEDDGYIPFVPFNPTIPGGEVIQPNDTPLAGDVIEDEDVPLAGLPNTGSESGNALLFAGMAAIVMAGAAILVIRRRNAESK
ncbi:MAG: LPXTG cell wall anchor domain-containing protein, partial [Clostridia bacterium]|nr:LPXTG cell wall anchor domain-containing protein [Clostridia bacterium]